MNRKAFKILVVDDDEIVRDVLTGLLSREGYAVVSAGDGLEAIGYLKSEDVHLVVTDLMMPGADGIEVLKYTVRKDPDIAVVILTAFGTLDTTLQAIKEGAYDYLTKPFKTLEIAILADRAYRRALLIDENRELKKNLLETYRDAELIKSVAAGGNAEMTDAWLERVEKLRTMHVLLAHEAEIWKERLVRSYAKGQDTGR